MSRGAELYYERQRRDLCRLHATNMLIGSRCYDEASFNACMRVYQRVYEAFPMELDGVHEDGTTGVTFAVEQARGDLTLVPYEDCPCFRDPDMLAAHAYGAVLASSEHVWAARVTPEGPVLLDSLRGRPQPMQGPEGLRRALDAACLAWVAVPARSLALALACVTNELRAEVPASDADGPWARWLRARLDESGIELGPPRRAPAAARGVILVVLGRAGRLLALVLRMMRRMRGPAEAAAATLAGILRTRYVVMAEDPAACAVLLRRLVRELLRAADRAREAHIRSSP